MGKPIDSMQLIRYAVGYVFLASGIMKLLVSSFVTVFANYGIPYPELMVLIVAITEIVCGGLIILNYYVKNATIPLFIIMIVAVLLTKVPILHDGFFQFAFDARLDIVMLALLTIIFRRY